MVDRRIPGMKQGVAHGLKSCGRAVGCRTFGDRRCEGGCDEVSV